MKVPVHDRPEKPTPTMIQMSSGLFPVSQSIGEQNELSKIIKGACLLAPHQSKYKPKKADRAKSKPQPKATQKVVPKKPPAQSKTEVVHESFDDERYALWWDFHDDLTKRIKTTAYPPTTKDRMEGYRKQRGSLESKARINAVKAVGVTPRKQARAPKLIGNAPHPGDKDAFSKVIADNKDYERVLISRYCTASSIARSLPQMFGHLDHICGITTQPIQVRVSDELNVSDVITKLERVVEADKQTAKVEAVTVDQIRYDDKLMRAEAKVFDLDISDMLPFAANDNDYSVSKQKLSLSDTLDSENQWSPACQERYEFMCKHKREYRGTPEAKALVRLKRAYSSDRMRYSAFLRNHSSDYYQRELVEQARHRAMPEYEMKLGETVHPLYHHGEDFFNETVVLAHMPRRLGMCDMDVIGTCNFGQWYQRTSPAKPEQSIVDKWLDFGDEKKEVLVDKLIDSSLERHSRQTTFKEWSLNIATYIEYLNGLLPVAVYRPKDTTSSETSPTPQTDAIFDKWAEERKQRAEVVSLADERLKREQSVSRLVSKLSTSMLTQINNLSEEQKEELLRLLQG